MKNLARHDADAETRKEVTDICRQELEMARIPVVETLAKGEVPSDVAGRLGEFEFRRAWYYWTVKGRVPIALARKMYEDPLGKVMVRVAGHCGCPPPDQMSDDGTRLLWARWIMADGKIVITTKEEKGFIEVEASLPNWRDKYTVNDDPTGLIGAECFVTSYHIDDLGGLRLFADTVRDLEWAR